MIQLSSRIIFFSIHANHFGQENVWHEGTWAREACKARGHKGKWARKARGHARHEGTQGTWARGHVGMQGTWARGRMGTQGAMARRACRARDLAGSKEHKLMFK